MSDQNYLLKFRQCHRPASVEALFDYLEEKLTHSPELQLQMYRAADHRRAELAANRNFDKVPESMWTNVK